MLPYTNLWFTFRYLAFKLFISRFDVSELAFFFLSVNYTNFITTWLISLTLIIYGWLTGPQQGIYLCPGQNVQKCICSVEQPY